MSGVVSVTVEETSEGGAIVSARYLFNGHFYRYCFVVKASKERFHVRRLRVKTSPFVVTKDVQRCAYLVLYRVANEIGAVLCGYFGFFLVRPVNEVNSVTSICVWRGNRTVFQDLLWAIRFNVARLGEEI